MFTFFLFLFFSSPPLHSSANVNKQKCGPWVACVCVCVLCAGEHASHNFKRNDVRDVHDGRTKRVYAPLSGAIQSSEVYSLRKWDENIQSDVGRSSLAVLLSCFVADYTVRRYTKTALKKIIYASLLPPSSAFRTIQKTSNSIFCSARFLHGTNDVHSGREIISRGPSFGKTISMPIERN